MWCHCRSNRLATSALVFGAAAYAFSLAMPRPVSTPPDGLAVAPMLQVPPALDGLLDEWGRIDSTPLDASSHLLTDSARYTGAADLSGQLMFAWDTTYLYVAGRFSDDSLAGGAAWTSDRVNLVLDFRNDNHPLSYGGQPPAVSDWQVDDHWLYAHIVGDGEPPYPVMRMGRDYHGPIADSGLASRRTADGWDFEMRIPWSQLPESRPFVGAVMGLQLFVSDGDGEAGLTEIMWSDRWGWTQDAGLQWELWRMGKLVLTGRPLVVGGAYEDD